MIVSLEDVMDSNKLIWAIEEVTKATKDEDKSYLDTPAQCFILAVSEIKSGSFNVVSCPDDPSKVSYKTNNGTTTVTTLARFLRRNISACSTNLVGDTSFNILCQNIITKIGSKNGWDDRLKLLQGQDIVEHYKTTDSNSCMTGKNSIFTELYALNPDKVMLVVLDSFARALLWTCDDGTKVLDRIYPAGCQAINDMRQWASEQGYILRMNATGAPYDKFMEGLTDNSAKQITVKFSKYFPYLDTFRFILSFDECDKTVVLSNKWSNRVAYIADHTDGVLPWENTEDTCICYCCDVRTPNDDISDIYGNHYCQRCYSENACTCEYCDEIVHCDDVRFINDNCCVCDSCLEEYYEECKHCEFIYCVKNNRSNGESCVCTSCYRELYKKCYECADIWLQDDMSSSKSGNYFCADCYDTCLIKCDRCEAIVEKANATKVAKEPDVTVYICESCTD